jgi:hypothetical protein
LEGGRWNAEVGKIEQRAEGRGLRAEGIEQSEWREKLMGRWYGSDRLVRLVLVKLMKF